MWRMREEEDEDEDVVWLTLQILFSRQLERHTCSQKKV